MFQRRIPRAGLQTTLSFPKFCGTMKRLFSLLVCVLIFSPSLRAEGPDEQYVRIYQLVQEADRLNDSGQGRAAATKYIEAQEALTRFRGIYPGWNERVINYRLDYVATKLAPLSALHAWQFQRTPRQASRRRRM
jgi:hypothetical protein